MEGLGAAANIIAVIELSAKIASICLQYSHAVKKAKADIERLQGELDRLKITLEGAQQLLMSPNSNRLHTSQRLHDGLRICDFQLKRLETRLEENLNIGKRNKVMSRFGIRSLKWPFESTEVNATITTFKNYRDELSAALSIDQTTEILDIGQKFVLSKLPTAGDAAFGSYADQYDAQCHPETRVALLQNIMTWAEDSQSKCVFWLNGMAGTGKSTISRTVTQSFTEKGVLGGSFFFKRGEGNRSNAALLFTTIAAQLVTKEPILATCIRDAIDNNPDLPRKALEKQFEKLILEPLTILNNDAKKSKKIVLVIDALDECEQEKDIKVIISLLSQARMLKSVQLRTFVISRPKLPIRLGFNNIEGHYQDLLLHQIPVSIIEHDITAFLWYNLSRIRNKYNN
ncbi:uncharacterized protein EAF02_000210 [Botrytis sinoallii]|uniref:uncharacterized protein n=1 Tax=Botrytis sinoallii TaxID=1463999 RepID=UPI00190218E2|nr:uncharacterized protein EAF02_000210 [Botrytis sinoallii]KAF7892672.1 hypothetical protein EAF02_000210 [Botrytis sinoallii]